MAASDPVFFTPTTVYEVHEDSLEGHMESSLGISVQQSVDLVNAGMLVPRMTVVQFDIAPGIDPNTVLERLGY